MIGILVRVLSECQGNEKVVKQTAILFHTTSYTIILSSTCIGYRTRESSEIQNMTAWLVARASA